MAPAGWELLVPACTSKTLVGPGKVKGSHGCSSWPPGCAAGLAATCVWGQDAGAEHCCCAPPPTKNPLPRARLCSPGVGCHGKAGLRGLLSSWCGAQAARGEGAAERPVATKGVAVQPVQREGAGLLLCQVTPGTVAPGHPMASTQTQCQVRMKDKLIQRGRLPLLPGGLPSSVKTEQERHPPAHPDLHHQAQLHQRNTRHPTFT